MKEKKLRCYIASPFFTPEAVNEVEIIKSILESYEIDYFSPKDHNLCLPNASQEDRKKCFERNLAEIDKCDLMISNSRDKDIGTMVETGYARKAGKPVILFTPQIRGMPINLMLSELFIAMAFEKEELDAILRIIVSYGFTSSKLKIFKNKGDIE